MATAAPITGAPTRASNYDRPLSSTLTDLSLLLSQVETLLFASELAMNDMGGIENDEQRKLIGHIDSLGMTAAGLVGQARAMAETLEIGLLREGR